MKEYPEHQKMHEVKVERQAIVEFIENLENLGLTLCDAGGDGFGHMLGTSRSLEQILAQHFDIDLKKIEEERQDMLDTIRANNAMEREL